MPRAVDGATVAQEDIDPEAPTGRCVHIRAERTARRRVPGHPVTGFLLVREGLVDRTVGDDHEAGVVVGEELQSGELRGEARAAAALPLGTRRPHVVVDDELGPAVEHIDQVDRPFGADQGVVGQFNHRQTAPLRGDPIQLARGSLLAFAQLVKRGAPGLVINDWRQG